MVISMPIQSKEMKVRCRYMITIDECETPAYVSRELQPGVVTIMITARTPEEAEDIRKESTAIAQSNRT